MKRGVNLIKSDNVINFGRNKMTVLQLHRKIQEMEDTLPSEGRCLDITDVNASIRHNDYIIEIVKPYRLTEESFKFIKNGVIIQNGQVIDLKVSKESLYQNHLNNVEIFRKRLAQLN